MFPRRENFVGLVFRTLHFFLPFVKKCIVVAFHWDFFVHFDYLSQFERFSEVLAMKSRNAQW